MWDLLIVTTFAFSPVARRAVTPDTTPLPLLISGTTPQIGGSSRMKGLSMMPAMGRPSCTMQIMVVTYSSKSSVNSCLCNPKG